MFQNYGISFDQFEKEMKNLPQLNVESKIVNVDNKYLPIDQRKYLTQIAIIEKDNQNIQIKADFIYNTIVNIPQFYFTLQNVDNGAYIQLEDFLEDKNEMQYFIRDINPITGIVMFTLHNCLLAEFIGFLSTEYLVPLLSYYYSKIGFYVKEIKY